MLSCPTGEARRRSLQSLAQSQELRVSVSLESFIFSHMHFTLVPKSCYLYLLAVHLALLQGSKSKNWYTSDSYSPYCFLCIDSLSYKYSHQTYAKKTSSMLPTNFPARGRAHRPIGVSHLKECKAQFNNFPPS